MMPRQTTRSERGHSSRHGSRINVLSGTGTAAPDSRGWSRGRLRGVLALTGVIVVLLVCGLGYGVYLTVRSMLGEPSDPRPERAVSAATVTGPRSINGTDPNVGGQAVRGLIAAAPMVGVPVDAMQPTAPTTEVAESISVGPPARLGPEEVPTGFPHTPQGAVGQLAQIEVTVLQAMSLRRAAAVHAAWALPGAGTATDWQLTRNVQAFLTSAQLSGEPTASQMATVTATPAAGLVKGTDGPDWTLACVLLRVTAVVRVEANIGYGYCEPMQWTPDAQPDTQGQDTQGPDRWGPAGPAQEGQLETGRWMIAPGGRAATAPSTWPGSAAALEAGWQTWLVTPGWDAGDIGSPSDLGDGLGDGFEDPDDDSIGDAP